MVTKKSIACSLHSESCQSVPLAVTEKGDILAGLVYDRKRPPICLAFRKLEKSQISAMITAAVNSTMLKTEHGSSTSVSGFGSDWMVR